MKSPVQLLARRLIARGVYPDHIPGLIRNVLGIIGEGGAVTSQLVNEKLEQLGWDSEMLDETSFELIFRMLESEWGYRVRRVTGDIAPPPP